MSIKARVCEVLDQLLAAVARIGMWLALPFALLLFLRWPLRSLAPSLSLLADDGAQVLYALMLAVAVLAAGQRGQHLQADGWARRLPAHWRSALARGAAVLVLLPWSAWLLWSSAPIVWNSVRRLDAFAETGNPGNFLIKIALWLLGVLVLLAAVRAIGAGRRA
jgi:TRAP-type mannitol/chloroaromatic compound transport system permease small subunit